MNETVNSAKTFRPAGWLAFHRDSDARNRKDSLAHASSPARSTRQSVFTTKLHGSQGPNCAVCNVFTCYGERIFPSTACARGTRGLNAAEGAVRREFGSAWGAPCQLRRCATVSIRCSRSSRCWGLNARLDHFEPPSNSTPR